MKMSVSNQYWMVITPIYEINIIVKKKKKKGFLSYHSDVKMQVTRNRNEKYDMYTLYNYFQL